MVHKELIEAKSRESVHLKQGNLGKYAKNAGIEGKGKHIFITGYFHSLDLLEVVICFRNSSK